MPVRLPRRTAACRPRSWLHLRPMTRHWAPVAAVSYRTRLHNRVNPFSKSDPEECGQVVQDVSMPVVFSAFFRRHWELFACIPEQSSVNINMCIDKLLWK